jgi:hypothetical protein
MSGDGIRIEGDQPGEGYRPAPGGATSPMPLLLAHAGQAR